MTDLSITAANVVAGSNARKSSGIAGATITAGQVVYLDPTTGTYKLADTDSATAAVRQPAGIALHGASANQPLTILTEGDITIGAAVTQGVAYYLSGTAGGICPIADVASGDYTCVIGVAKSATVLMVKFVYPGVVL